jgi:hypothetical protein
MTNQLSIKLTALVLTFFSCCMVNAQTADDIIAKHFSATGGIEKWAKVVSVKTTGTYVMGPGMLAPVLGVSCTKPFEGSYSSFSWQGMTASNAMRADSGWSYNPFGGKRETDPMGANEIRSTKLSSDPQGLLFNYKQKEYTVDYLGVDDMDGEEVYKLRLTTKDGDMIYYFIDANSYYILKTYTRVKLKDKEEKSYRVFSDFRKTEYGIVLPFSEQGVDENGADRGGPVNYTKVEVNANVDPTLFEKPIQK